MTSTKIFHIPGPVDPETGEPTLVPVLATQVLAHGIGKGDMLAMTSQFGNGDFLRTVVGHPVHGGHRTGEGKLRIDLGDGLELGSGHLFGLNDPLWRVVGARSGGVGSR